MLRKPGQIWKDKIHRENLMCNAETSGVQANGSGELWEKNRTIVKRKEEMRGITRE